MSSYDRSSVRYYEEWNYSQWLDAKNYLTVPKIKSFFQKTSDTMQRLLNNISIEEDRDTLEEEEIEEIRNLKVMEDGGT